LALGRVRHGESEAYKSFVFSKKDCHAGVDLADGEGYQHFVAGATVTIVEALDVQWKGIANQARYAELVAVVSPEQNQSGGRIRQERNHLEEGPKQG
jgi:hypothetical protein